MPDDSYETCRSLLPASVRQTPVAFFSIEGIHSIRRQKGLVTCSQAML